MNRSRRPCEAANDFLRLDARDVAALLGLTPERLMAELRAGTVHQSAEEPAPEDGWPLRITFRYRNRVARLLVDADGTAHPEIGQTH